MFERSAEIARDLEKPKSSGERHTERLELHEARGSGGIHLARMELTTSRVPLALLRGRPAEESPQGTLGPVRSEFNERLGITTGGVRSPLVAAPDERNCARMR